jgi:hypothetical protein
LPTFSRRDDFGHGRLGARRRQSVREVGLECVENMIRTYADIDGFKFNASLTGLAVYLDNFAIIDIAKGDPLRRQRFISALHSGAELLFSVSNSQKNNAALEASGLVSGFVDSRCLGFGFVDLRCHVALIL